MSQALIYRFVANPVAEAHRHAYNAAFEELNLSFRWDAATYVHLQRHGRDLVRAYLQTDQAHLLRAYDADFLVSAIEAVKTRCQEHAEERISHGHRMMQAGFDVRHRREALRRVSA